MEDKQILALYFARNESAIAETARKYGSYCHSISYRILQNHEDAEEIVNDTYLRAWNSIPPHKPEPLKPYLGTVSRRLSLDVYREKHTQKQGGGQISLILEELSECIPDSDSRVDIGESLVLREVLNKFVCSLPKKAAQIFIRRYWYTQPISEIAKDYGMKENTVTVLLNRTRKKLQQALEKEGFEP